MQRPAYDSYLDCAVAVAYLCMFTQMKLFGWLFAISLVVELLLLACSAAFHGDHLVYAPLIPAIWIAMAIGGVHSAGFISFVCALTVAAFLYGILLFALSRLVAALRR